MSDAAVAEPIEISDEVKKVAEEALKLDGEKKGHLLLELVSNMTGRELADAKNLLEDQLGVTAGGGGGMMMMAGPVDGGPAEEEQTEFEVHLASIGEKKIQVIKAIRSLTQLGLKEAKGLVDGAPCLVKDGLSKEDADKMKEELEAAGAAVEIK